MTDGGDIPLGMDGEENVGGISWINKKGTQLVPLIEDIDDDSPSKNTVEEEYKENHDGKIRKEN
jgi:hypothetical protein